MTFSANGCMGDAGAADRRAPVLTINDTQTIPSVKKP